jgi:hypothetical protein
MFYIADDELNDFDEKRCAAFWFTATLLVAAT